MQLHTIRKTTSKEQNRTEQHSPQHFKLISYSSTMEDKGKSSKLRTDCKKEHAQSLNCIQENYENKDVACQPFFAAYKACRAEEHERRLEANKKSFFG